MLALALALLAVPPMPELPPVPSGLTVPRQARLTLERPTWKGRRYQYKGTQPPESRGDYAPYFGLHFYEAPDGTRALIQGTRIGLRVTPTVPMPGVPVFVPLTPYPPIAPPGRWMPTPYRMWGGRP
jgi:hypothetical protein